MRCAAELTDAASQEAGIGPICRRQDNVVLAKQIPSDINTARAQLAELMVYFDGALEKGLSEATAATLFEVSSALMHELAPARDDWRKVVKQMEWLGSWPLPSGVDSALIRICRALGYVTLAAIWEDPRSVARGKATVFHDGGRLYLLGPNCSGGRHALKLVTGRVFSTGRGSPGLASGQPNWSVPSQQWSKLREVVLTYWPNVDVAALDVACALAREDGEVEVGAKPSPSGTIAVVRLAHSNMLSVKTPYNANFIDRVKQLQGRRWNGDSKCWEVPAEHWPYLASLIQSCYGVALNASVTP